MADSAQHLKMRATVEQSPPTRTTLSSVSRRRATLLFC